ncbi:hypothetical protein FIV42_19395 [Persicimonas caeni]|uniref:EF-hand domain-containing protein n=1 Tax=Persicimonas caeni TaxID=2292766 RepID=A0A4Y6PWY4_PERCE|nr:hypothetical protein [Persicimonas caeni]QDG52831.1 hypothetical protein FIV42_19395 [Persicimonas caeni]QED34053.1 hypothetical protein FRD00_19390 [Persicimonas caeni]
MERNSLLAVVVLFFLAPIAGFGLVGCDTPSMLEESDEESGPGEAVPEGLIDNWVEFDTTGDDVLDREEYRQAIRDQRLFSQWDIDEDKQLNKEEFARGMFDMWDGNNDGVLTEPQYMGAIDAWFEKGTELGAFSSLDVDGDGQLTRDEFLQNVDIDPVFSRFDNDSDDNIAQNEYGEGLFITNDSNGDGVITQSETLF